MISSSILWRRLDRSGHDSARLTETARGAALDGTALFAEAGNPCRLDYTIVVDPAWRTRTARICGWLNGRSVTSEISVDDDRIWTMNGTPCPEVEGCEDIDLSFSPSTNLLPIRRLSLNAGERRQVIAAWLRFPEMTLEPLVQCYECISPTRYRYQSGTGNFRSVLETNVLGFVLRYPGLWEMEAE